MQMNRVWSVWFSGTGTTKKTVCRLGSQAAEHLGVDWMQLDFTPKNAREESMVFVAGDLVFFGVPVIAGRVPNVLLPFLREKVVGNGALAVPVVLFGNRNYDDALIELRDILQTNGFVTVAGAAFVGEHSFSCTLGAGRPDAKDTERMDSFAAQVTKKVAVLSEVPTEPVMVRGENPIRPYYTPRDRQGNPINILKVKPKTDLKKCIRCGYCAACCPMGSIDPDDVTKVTGICMKCCACVKGCPAGAKYYDDEGYLYHQRELEEMYSRRADPEVFL